jgi:hypothetical protein
MDIQNTTPGFKQLHDALCDFFEHPVMTKRGNVSGFSKYATQIYCLLSNQYRYIIVFVKEDVFPIEYVQPLSNLKWDSFQTRTLTENFDLPRHNYIPKRKKGFILDSQIKRTKFENGNSEYSCERLPEFTISLIHTSSDINDYQSDGTLVRAIETYQTLITHTGISGF